MGTARLAVTKHLLHECLMLPHDVEIVGAAECPYNHSVDIVVSGPRVPDADRCQLQVSRVVKHEFKAVEGE